MTNWNLYRREAGSVASWSLPIAGELPTVLLATGNGNS
jgi:hypothetical protein